MTVDESQRKAAKVAAATSLFAMAIVTFTHYGITLRLVVPGDAAQTVHNIVAHERLFRTVVACMLAYGAGTVVLLSALYVVLRPVSRGLALAAAAFRMVFALTWVVISLKFLEALRLVSGADYLQALEADSLQALSRFSLGATSDAYYVGLPFYGLAATVCSYLWFKSRYIPRWLATAGVITSAWCVVSAFAYIIVPGFGTAVNLYTLDSPMALFEIVTSFWLLFKGLRA
jgi:hypothetical protein